MNSRKLAIAAVLPLIVAIMMSTAAMAGYIGYELVATDFNDPTADNATATTLFSITGSYTISSGKLVLLSDSSTAVLNPGSANYVYMRLQSPTVYVVDPSNTSVVYDSFSASSDTIVELYRVNGGYLVMINGVEYTRGTGDATLKITGVGSVDKIATYALTEQSSSGELVASYTGTVDSSTGAAVYEVELDPGAYTIEISTSAKLDVYGFKEGNAVYGQIQDGSTKSWSWFYQYADFYIWYPLNSKNLVVDTQAKWKFAVVLYSGTGGSFTLNIYKIAGDNDQATNTSTFDKIKYYAQKYWWAIGLAGLFIIALMFMPHGNRRRGLAPLSILMIALLVGGGIAIGLLVSHAFAPPPPPPDPFSGLTGLIIAVGGLFMILILLVFLMRFAKEWTK